MEFPHWLQIMSTSESSSGKFWNFCVVVGFKGIGCEISLGIPIRVDTDVVSRNGLVSSHTNDSPCDSASISS